MNKKNTKAQMQGMPIAIISLVIAVVILVTGLIIVQEVRDSDLLTKAESATYINESVTGLSDAGDILNCGSNPASLCSVTTVMNRTSYAVVPTSNYSVSGCTIYTRTGLYNGTNVNVTYTCTYGGEAYTAGNSSLVGLGDFADFIPLIVIALVAGLVVAIVIGSMMMRGRER